MALHDVAVDFRRMAGSHLLRHAELRLYRLHVGLDDFLDDIARLAHARRPFAAAAAGRALVHGHFPGVVRASGAGKENGRGAEEAQVVAAGKARVGHGGDS